MNQWRNNLAGPFTTFILTPHAPQTTTRFLCSLSSKIPLGTVSTHYLLFFPLCLLAVSEHSWPWSSTSSPYLVPPSGPHVCATDLMIFLLPCDSLCLHSFTCVCRNPGMESTDVLVICRRHWESPQMGIWNCLFHQMNWKIGEMSLCGCVSAKIPGSWICLIGIMLHKDRHQPHLEGLWNHRFPSSTPEPLIE